MLAGTLTEFSLPDVFTLLASTRKSGVLQVEGTDAAGRVWVVTGQIAYAVADVRRSPMAARLLHGGEVDAAAVEPLVRAQAAGHGAQVAAALSELGVEGERAVALLRDQVVDAVFDLSRWPAGQFSFDASLEVGPGGPIPTFAVEDVLAAVEARAAEWEGIVAALPSPAAVLHPVPRPQTRDGQVQMTGEQWEVLTHVDGVRSVADVIRLTGQGQFTVAKRLASLVTAGLLQVRLDAGGRTVTEERADRLARIEADVLGAPLPAAPAPVAHQPVEPPRDEPVPPTTVAASLPVRDEQPAEPVDEPADAPADEPADEPADVGAQPVQAGPVDAPADDAPARTIEDLLRAVDDDAEDPAPAAAPAPDEPSDGVDL
jgi:hypothetical protein